MSSSFLRTMHSKFRNIVVLQNREVPEFVSNDAFAAVTFVGSRRGSRTPPKLLQRVPRIIIRADDCYPHSSIDSVALTSTDADRIASFVASQVSRIETLLVSCKHGEGRSAAVAVVAAAAYGLDWERFVRAPYAPNGWIIDLLSGAFVRRGIELPEGVAHFDAIYHRNEEGALARSAEKPLDRATTAEDLSFKN
jgi:hypothetical protein